MKASVIRVRQSIVALAMIGSLFAATARSEAAQAQTVEERFQDLFVTAGYATAFGAAIGTAFLAFHEDPSAHLRYVAVGASLGFLGGSVLGSYIIFSPMMSSDDSSAADNSLIASNAIPGRGIAVRPTWNRDTQNLGGIEAGMTLVNF